MARRKGAKTIVNKQLEARVQAINVELDQALATVERLRTERTRLWFLMFNGHDYTQRSVATISNRGIAEGSPAWATDDAVEKALMRAS